MRIERAIYSVLVVAASIVAVINWRKATLFEMDNEELRSRIEALEVEAAGTARILEIAKKHSDKVRAQTVELKQLRDEVIALHQNQSARSLTNAIGAETLSVNEKVEIPPK